MNDLPSDDDVGVDSAFFPRANWDGDEGDNSGMAGLGDDDAAFERIDDDEAGRRETLGRESFGAIEVNFDDADQSTVMLQPQVESSPRRESSSSPRNEAFGMEDAPLPEEMEVDDNATKSLDLRSNGEAEAEGDSDIDFGDLASGAAIAEAVGQTTKPSRSNRFKKPGKKISQHGIEYPSLPPGVVKRVAQRFAGKSKISPDTLAALVQASDWFFEQLGDDLSAYAKHAGRKTIEESDMLTLMRRYVASFSTRFAAGYHRNLVHFVHFVQALTKSLSPRQTTAGQCQHDAIRARTASFATRAPTRAANASSRTGPGEEAPEVPIGWRGRGRDVRGW
jgi:histone H3/H4